MSESSEDTAVDTLISDLQGTLDKLKKAQGKDVADESDDYPEPKTVKDAGKKAYRLMRAERLKNQDKE